MSDEKIKEKIKKWQFTACPTEEKEPFFWRWTEHGLEMLATYIRELIEETKKDENTLS